MTIASLVLLAAIGFLLVRYVMPLSRGEASASGEREDLDEASPDAGRILARMKAMAAPTLLLRSASVGGDPEMPVGASWPVGPDAPLGFLVQIDLADARAGDFSQTVALSQTY
jgi:hypothetical protein